MSSFAFIGSGDTLALAILYVTELRYLISGDQACWMNVFLFLQKWSDFVIINCTVGEHLFRIEKLLSLENFDLLVYGDQFRVNVCPGLKHH